MPQDNPSVGSRFLSATRMTLYLQRIFISRVVGIAFATLSLLAVLLFGAFISLSQSQVAQAQTPNTTLNFQARILNLSGSLVPDGNYHVEFKIYDTVSSGGTAQGACSGNCLWMETRTGGDVVRVVNGYVSANLGSVTSFPTNMPWGNNLYITMRVGGMAPGASWDALEMTNTGNRMKMSVAPVAFVANNVASGSTNSASTNSSTISIQSGNALGTTSNSGNITIDSGTATGTTGTVVLGATNASALTIGRAGVTTTLQGSVALTGAGTALTVTNNAVFNGDITLGNASADTLTVNANANFTGNLSVTTGDTFTNAGSSVYTALAISDVAGGGAIGTAAATVDGATTFNIGQTTASQALTLPAPTVTTAGRIVYVNNVGSASFTMYGTTIATNGSNAFIWNGTQWITTVSLSGSSVSVVGTIDSQTKSADGAVIVGNAIYLQTADATNVGLVSTGTQTLAGAKTLSGAASFTAAGTGLAVTNNATIGGNLTVGSGAGVGLFTNNGATVNTTLALGNFATGGSIGSAATTVDVYTGISVAQTTTGQTLTISAPTANTTYGRTIFLSNIGTASFTLLGNVVAPGNAISAVWSNTTGGASWQTSGTAKSGGTAGTVSTSASGGASGAVASKNPYGADYINTSTTNAQTIINIALSEVGALGGGTVYLLEGTYIIDGSINIPNNTTLAGSGNNTVIKFKNATNLAIAAITNTDTSTGRNVIVKDLYINGNASNQSIVTNGMYGVRIDGAGGSGQGGVISNVLIFDIYTSLSSGQTGSGIVLNNSRNFLVANNRLQSNFISGIAIFGNSQYNTVSGNEFNGNNAAAEINGSSFNLFSNNSTSNNSGWGVAINNGSTYNTISNNNINTSGFSTANEGIVVSASDFNQIIGNTITDTQCTFTCRAINISDSTSDKNYLEANRFSGSTANPASINNAGTGTIFAGQQTNSSTGEAAGANDVSDFRFRGSANSDTAFAVQNASGTSILNVDTNGTNTVGITGVLTVSSTSTFTGLTTLNGGLTVEAGDTFTFNGDAFTDFTGGGLVNTGGVLTVDATTATGFFQNAGNSFGAASTIGTNDAFGLSVETNNTVRASFANSNILYLGNADSATGLAASPNAFSVLGTGNSTATGAGGAVTLQAGAGNTSGAGGLTTVNGGVAGATGFGGGVTIRAGAGGTTSGDGGAITIASGAGTAGNANSGAVNISTASGIGVNTSGSINLAVGQGLSQGSINLSTAQFTGLYGNFNIGAAGGRTQLGTATTNAKLSVVNVGSVYDTDSVILGQSSATQTGNLLTLRNNALANLFVVDINGNTSVAGTQTISGNLTVDTNTLFVNSASDFVNIGSTTDELAKFAIVGSADEEQLLIRAAAGQTVANPLVLLQNSSSAELARINASTTSLYFGNAAGGNSAAGVNNTGIGASALGSVLTGTGNTTLGSGALASVSVNNNNTAVGYNAGNLATGGNNIFLGALAGDNVTTGTDNIIIGYNLDASAAGVTNELRLGGVLQGNTSTLAAQFNGTLGITTLGTTDNASFVCRNTSNILAGCNFTPLSSSITDNITDAFDLQEGTNNYININTTNTSENISFGNANTNPSFSFLGSGGLTVSGAVNVNNNLNVLGTISSPYGGFGQIGNGIRTSEDFDSARWIQTNITSVTDGALAPNGRLDADTIVSSGSGAHTLLGDILDSGAGTYTFSVWLKATSGTQPVQLRMSSTGGTPGTGTATSYTIDTTWRRYSVTQTFTGSPTGFTGDIIITNNSASIEAWGAQSQLGTSMGVYTPSIGESGADYENGAVVANTLRVFGDIFFGNGDPNGTTQLFNGGLQSNSGYTVLADVFNFNQGGGGATKLTIDTTGAPVISTGTNLSVTISPNGTGDVIFSQDDGTNFQLSGSRTNTGASQTIAVTLGNDAGVDTVSALQVNVTSVATGDADILLGIDIANLASADATVVERALQIGSGWDANIFLNDTTTQIQVANTGVITFEDDAGNDLLTVTDGGTVGNVGVSGTLTVSQLLTANLGATVSGATINLNASSNFGTNINTSTSSGTVAIGNSLSTTTVLGTTNINTTGSTNTLIGSNTNTFTLDTSNIDISNTGAISGVTGYTQSAGNFNYTSNGASLATFTSDLSAGARSASVLSVTQANDATNNNSAALVSFTNNDTASTNVAVLALTQAATGVLTPVLQLTGASNNIGLNLNGVTTGIGASINTITTGNAVTGGTALTSGTQYNTILNGTVLTSGSAFKASGTASGALAAYTGNLVDISPTRTLSGATINDTGSSLNINRTNSVTSANTFTVSGNLVNLLSTCSASGGGTCTDTGSILNLAQNYATASGAVLNLTGAGTGNLAVLDSTNTSSNGVLIDVQSNSNSQYALRVTTNNGAKTALQINGDGSISAGVAGFTTTVNGALTVTQALTASSTIAVTTLGTANTSTYVCRNSTLQLATCLGSPLTNALTDNITDSFDLQEGTNNYININTTDSSEAISFGNIVTNPDYNFLGSGILTVSSGSITSPGGSGSEQFGLGATAAGTNSVALGNGADASGNSSVALGEGSLASNGNSVAIGRTAIASGQQSIALSNGEASAQDTIAIGFNSDATTVNSIALGSGAQATGGGVGATALGYSSAASGDDSIALGVSSTANGYRSIAIGRNASNATFANSIALGAFANNTAANQIVIGVESNPINSLYLGGGVTGSNPTVSGNADINASGGSGTNVGGGSLTLAGGRSTGNVAGGSLLFQTSAAGASGASANALTTRLTIGSTGLATFANDLTVTGLTTLNGGLTVETGDTFTFNADAFTDFTGGGLVNSGGILTVDSTTATGFFRNAGNSFGAAGTIGTNDAFGLSIETNNTVRASFANSDILYLGNADPSTGLAATPNAFSVLGTSNSTAIGAGGAVTLQAGAGNTSGAGGLTTINGGVAGATGVGGGVTIRAGAGGSTSGVGGAITIASGAGTAGNSNSGAVNISTAAAVGTSTSGSINLTIGSGLSQGSINLATGQFGGLYGNFNIGAAGGRTQLGTAITNAKLSVVNVGSVYDTDSVILGQSSATQTGNLLTLRNNGLTNLFVVDINGNTSVAGTLAVTGLTTLNGGLTVETGDTFTFNADAFTDFTGGGLSNSGGILTVDATTATGFFQNGGNNFGGDATLGTTGAGQNLTVTTGTTGALTLDTGTTGTINLGVNANAKTINIGTGAAIVQTVNIGGTGANVIGVGNTQTAGTISLGAAMTTGTISIGGTGLQTGTISLGTGTGAQTINLGTGGTGIKTVNIGTGNTSNPISIGGTGANTIGVGNTQAGGSVSIGAGMVTGTVSIGGTGQNGTITLGASTSSSQTVNILSANATTSIQTINIGAGTSTTTGGKIVNIANGIPGASTTNTVAIGTAGVATGTVGVTIGSIGAAGHTTLIQGGNGATAITLTPQTTGSIVIGAAAGTGNITLGSSSATQSVLIGNGAGASTVSIANATLAGATVNIAGGANTSASTVSIANGATAAATTVSILSGVGTASTASLLLGNNTRVTTIDIGNIAAAAARTINLGTGANTVGIDTINIGTGNTTVAGGKTINIGNGTPSGAGSNLVSIGSTALASSTTLNAGTGLLNFNATNAQFTEVTGTRTLGVQTRTTGVAGTALTVQAGAGGAGAGFVGGALTLQGGTAGGSNANGGNVSLVGGVGIGTGVKGLVVVDTATFSAATAQVFGSSGNINQIDIDSSGSLRLNPSAAGYTATLLDPTNTTAGRLVYVSNVGAFDITLAANAGVETITLKPNTTATMLWNGTDWTAAGASSATDLQAAYDNTATSAGGAELVLNVAGGAADGLTIRNNATTPIVGGLLEVQTSIGSNLFTVNNNATEYSSNGGAETPLSTAAPTQFPVNTWDTTTGGTVSRFITTGDNVATGAASVSVVTTTTNHGARNRINTSLTSGLTYTVSYAVRGLTNFATLQTLYSPDGTTTGTTQCSTAQTVTSGIWTRVSCTFVASGTITSSNSILIRQTDATGRTFYIDNLSLNVNASVSYAGDGNADVITAWGDYEAGAAVAVTLENTIIYEGSGSVEALITPATANVGIRNNLAVTPAINTQYLVSFYARSTTTMTGSLAAGFLPAGGTGLPSGTAACVDYSTQSLVANTWTKITCLFTTTGTAISNADLVIYQTDSAARTIFVDALSITLNTNNSNNVQIGGGNKGGPATLFTLDRSAGNPIASNNDAYLGSMYYDTTSGRIQCYEADGWGACGAAPDNIVNLNPEYAGAVLNGTGVGTMTADFCAEQSGVLNVNTALCDVGQAKNYYKWTSPQATQQTYSIYVTYQLPATFNGFSSDDTVQLTARTDSLTNAAVTYEMYKSTGSAVTQCGTGETTVVTTADTWQSVGVSGNEATGCSFTSSSAGNFVIFKINVKANSNANAYVSTLSFVTTGR